MKKIAKFIALFFLILVLALVSFLTYLGIMPGLSSIFRTNKPRDLGVRYQEEAVQELYEKLAINLQALTQPVIGVKDSVIYEGEMPLSFSHSGTELTMMINVNKWRYHPLSQVQVRIIGNVAEVSGLLDLGKILPAISLTHSPAEVSQYLEKYKLPLHPPFYLKGQVNVIDNRVNLDIRQFQLANLPASQKMIAENTPAIESFVEDKLNAIPGLKVDFFLLEDGLAKFSGTSPSTIYTQR